MCFVAFGKFFITETINIKKTDEQNNKKCHFKIQIDKQ